MTNPDQRRRSVRLKDFDYAGPGFYFVTICTQCRECSLGEVSEQGGILLTRVGQIVRDAWEQIPAHFPAVRLDAYVIMPNHLHGLVVITREPVGAQHTCPDRRYWVLRPYSDLNIRLPKE
jgi:REP element-mobilizing transposase RayT